jgi:energy-coupling factor transport system ATP-binding protein
MSNNSIVVEDLTFEYPGGDEPVLRDASVTIEPGEFTAVVGGNGSGKTTLCKTFNGLIPHFFEGRFDGTVTVAGTDTRESDVAELSRTVGYVFQDFENQLVQETVRDDVECAPLNHGLEDYAERATRALETLGLADLEDRFVWELSGGQQHLVALAGVLAMDPDFVFVDEPAAQLDPHNARETYEQLRRLHEEEDKTIIVIEHHAEFIGDYCDEMILVSDGGVAWKESVEVGLNELDDLLAHDIHPPQVTMIADGLPREAGTRPDGRVRRARRVPITFSLTTSNGSPPSECLIRGRSIRTDTASRHRNIQTYRVTLCGESSMNGTIRHSPSVVVSVVSMGHFFSHFYKLVLPPLFPLLSGEFGLNNTQLGLIISVVALGGLLQVPVGTVVDRIGAKWVFVAGLGVTGGGMALIGVGPNYPSLLALAVITGVGQAAFHPADYALIETVTDAQRQGRAFGIHTFSGYAGSAAAPVVVGTLALATGWRVTLFAVGAAGVVYALVAAVALAPVYRGAVDVPVETPNASTDRSGGTRRAIRSVFQRPGLLLMVVFFLLVAFANKGIHTFTTVIAVTDFAVGEATGNTLLTAYFAFGALGILLGGVLADRYSPSRLITVTLALGAVGILATVSGLVPYRSTPLVAAFAVVGFFVSLSTPARDRLVSEQSGTGTTGVSFGIVFTGATVGSLIGPVLLGAVGDLASITVSFVLVALFYLLAGALTLLVGTGWIPTGSSPASEPSDRVE